MRLLSSGYRTALLLSRFPAPAQLVYDAEDVYGNCTITNELLLSCRNLEQ